MPRRVLEGIVSNKSEKTISVLVEKTYRHSLYLKTFKKSKKYLAHDPENQCNIGERVEIIEGSPISRRKSWRLVKIIK